MAALASVIAALVMCAWASVAGWSSDPPALCHFEGNTYSPGAVVEMIDGHRGCHLDDGTAAWRAIPSSPR